MTSRLAIAFIGTMMVGTLAYADDHAACDMLRLEETKCQAAQNRLSEGCSTRRLDGCDAFKDLQCGVYYEPIQTCERREEKREQEAEYKADEAAREREWHQSSARLLRDTLQSMDDDARAREQTRANDALTSSINALGRDVDRLRRSR
jgi:hypothetical protein